MVDLSWIKIDTDIFNNEKTILIESMPNSTEIMLIWFKLLCHAGKSNESGKFTICGRPYTAELFARVFRCQIALINEAFEVFEELGMIVRDDDGAVCIKNWRKYQSIDQADLVRSQTKARVAKHREKLKNEAQKQNPDEVESNDVTQCNAECNAPCNAECNGDSNAIEENRIEENRTEENRTEESMYVSEDFFASNFPDAPPSVLPPSDRPNGQAAEEELKPISGNGKNVVYLTESQEEELLDSLGYELYQAYLRRLSSFIIERRARIKFHYETIMRWYDEDKRDGTLPITDSVYNDAIAEKNESAISEAEKRSPSQGEHQRYGKSDNKQENQSYGKSNIGQEHQRYDKSAQQEERRRYGDFDPKDAFQMALKNSYGDDFDRLTALKKVH